MNDGIEIGAYTRKSGLSFQRVWQLVRQGKLIGRNYLGHMYVFEEPIDNKLLERLDQRPSRSTPRMGATTGESGAEDVSGGAIAGSALETLPSFEQAASHPTELALLIDHLSLAKEENTEILRLTQDSVARLTSMSDQVVAAKDELLRSKERALGDMQQKIEENNRTIRKLRQEKEDLNILIKTLSKN